MPSLANHQSNSFTKLTLEDVVAYFERPILLNEHGCWIWQGSVDNRGYGRYGPSMVYGIVWRLAGNKLERGNELLHQCTNRGCVNPDHIKAGTHKENMEEAAAAGVMGVKGKIPEAKLIEARKMLADGIMKQDVALFLGVSKPWITKFVKGEFKYAKLS